MDNYKLLVVDDAFFIRNLIKKAVSNKPNTNNLNISIIGDAKNADEAITFCETECPDIVTVDYLMPPGKNGIELIKQLKEKYPNIMILMISDTTEIESNAIDLGCQFLVKPFKEEMIWKKLDNLILTNQKSNKVDSVINEKNIVEKIEDSVIEDKTEFIEIVKPKKRKRKKKNTLDFGFEVAGSLDSIQIDTSKKPNINTENVKEEEHEYEHEKEKEQEQKKVQNVNNDDIKEISVCKEESCSSIEKETENLEEDDDFDFEFEEIDDEIDANINHDVNKDTQIKEIETKEDKDFEDDEDFEFEFDDDEEEIIDDNKSNETINESNVVEEELDFDKDDFEEKEIKTENDSSLNKVENKKSDDCYVDEDDDVFTFYEEDECEYEDKDIDKFKEEGVVKKDIVEETEDRTDDDEIADLIKEASYSLDEDTKVIPEKSTNSTLNLLENDDDVFVSVDLSNSEEKKKKDIDTSDFDTMLDNFETSEEFKITQDEIKHEEAFDEQLNSLDNVDFSLDDLEDTTIDLTTEDDYEESKSENEKETLTSDDLTTINFDNSDDSNLNIDIDIDEAEDIDLNESDDLNESNLDNENDLFMNYDESDMNLFDDEDDLFDDEFSSEIESNNINNSVTMENGKDDHEKSFDLDSDDLLFEDENDENDEFDLDQTYKLNNNKEDNYNIEHNDETMKEETIDSLIDDAYEDSDIIPIFDTQEMSTSEIIKQNQKMRRKKNLQKDEMMYKKNMSKNHRPDGTKVKQKDSFFSRFFKEK